MYKLSCLAMLLALLLAACGTAAESLPPTEPPPTAAASSPDEVYQRAALDTAALLLASIEDFQGYIAAGDLDNAQVRDLFGSEVLVWRREAETVQAMDVPAAYQDVHAQLVSATSQLSEAADNVDTWLETGDQAALDAASAAAAGAATTLQEVVSELTPTTAP